MGTCPLSDASSGLARSHKLSTTRRSCMVVTASAHKRSAHDVMGGPQAGACHFPGMVNM